MRFLLAAVLTALAVSLAPPLVAESPARAPRISPAAAERAFRAAYRGNEFVRVTCTAKYRRRGRACGGQLAPPACLEGSYIIAGVTPRRDGSLRVATLEAIC